METLAVAAFAGILGYKVYDASLKHKKYRDAVSAQKAEEDVMSHEFNEYVRDDYEAEMRKYNEFTEKQLLQMGMPLGDYEYYHGPQDDDEHEFFDPLNWPDRPNPQTLQKGQWDF